MAGFPTWMRARRSTRKLFGWTADKAPQPEAGGYTMFSKEREVHGGGLAARAGQEGVPPHWTVYLASDDVDAHRGQDSRRRRPGA